MTLTLLVKNSVDHHVTKVAREIYRAAKDYDRPRRVVVDGVERAARFFVFAPSLRGKSLWELQDGGMPFDVKVGLVKSCSYCGNDSCSRSVPVLSSYRFNLVVENGAYTGRVIVWERVDDYAY